MTSLDPFQEEISCGNNFLTITEMLPKEKERDKQTVKVEKMFQMHLVCMVTDLTYYCNLMSVFKRSVCSKTNRVTA